MTPYIVIMIMLKDSWFYVMLIIMYMIANLICKLVFVHNSNFVEYMWFIAI